MLTAYRGYRGLGRWSDLGGIIFSELLREKSQEPLTIAMSCMEGHDLMRIYIHRYTDLKVEVVREVAAAKTEGVVAIADSALCVLPEPGEGRRFELVSRPRFPGSFALYELRRY